MNNLEINGASWMTMNEQIRYMCKCQSPPFDRPSRPDGLQQVQRLTKHPNPKVGLSTIVIVLSVSLAFSAWSRAVLSFLFWVPLAVLAESAGFHDWWRQSPAYHVNLERRALKIVEKTSKERKKRKEKEKEQEKKRAVGGGGREAVRAVGVSHSSGLNRGDDAV